MARVHSYGEMRWPSNTQKQATGPGIGHLLSREDVLTLGTI